MKTLLKLSCLFMLLFLFSCETEPVLEEYSYEQKKAKPLCSPNACHETGCTGIVKITVTSVVCPTNDCYWTLSKPVGFDDCNCTPQGYSSPSIPMQVGTYIFDVDLNPPGIPNGTNPTTYYDHQYNIIPKLGPTTTNPNNMVTYAWEGASTGTQTFVNNAANVGNAIFPVGKCN